jgi:hypothetical protein
MYRNRWHRLNLEPPARYKSQDQRLKWGEEGEGGGGRGRGEGRGSEGRGRRILT